MIVKPDMKLKKWVIAAFLVFDLAMIVLIVTLLVRGKQY